MVFDYADTDDNPWRPLVDFEGQSGEEVNYLDMNSKSNPLAIILTIEWNGLTETTIPCDVFSPKLIYCPKF